MEAMRADIKRAVDGKKETTSANEAEAEAKAIVLDASRRLPEAFDVPIVEAFCNLGNSDTDVRKQAVQTVDKFLNDHPEALVVHAAGLVAIANHESYAVREDVCDEVLDSAPIFGLPEYYQRDMKAAIQKKAKEHAERMAEKQRVIGRRRVGDWLRARTRK